MLRQVVCSLWLLAGCPLALAAQSWVPVGSETDRYLRWLEIAGPLPPHQWTLRPLTSEELGSLEAGDGSHVWARLRRLDLDGDAQGGGAGSWLPSVRLLPVSAKTYANTSFPWGYNDGPVWQGRGLTAAVSAGIAARWGPLSLVLQPAAFWAQNLSFELQPNGFADSLRFAHGRFPTAIDAPQRFGDTPYWRLDPGQSTLAVAFPIVTAGISTANQWWGPAAVNPVILGNNAPGFRHLFLGTSRPLDLWIAKVHGRVLWGDLRQSRFTRNLPPADRRFFSGLAAVVEPRGLEGLEMGAGRVFHDPWPEQGLSLALFAKPFGDPLKVERPPGANPENPGDEPEDNGLGSVWFRWTHPRDGLEFYAEYAKEDYNWDLRDVIGEPENSGGYLLGLRKLWGWSDTGFWGFEVEHLDLRPSQYVLGRGGTWFYVHGRRTQGHTQLGQILGSEFGVGGFASTVALERYHRGGRWRVSWMRALRQDFEQLVPADPKDPYTRVMQVATLDPQGYDMVHALGAEGVFFRGPLEFSGGITAIYEFNRYLANDAANLNAWVGVRWVPGLSASPRAEGAAAVPAPVLEAPHQAAGGPSDRSAACWFAPSLLVDPSGLEVERCRLNQLLGEAGPAGFLLRSPSSVMPRLPGPPARPRWQILAPRVALVHNSALPFSLNDGPLWAGVGSNLLVTAGVRAAWGPVSLVVAPQVAASANRPFEMPDRKLVPLPLPPGRDSLSNPWHIRPGSIDLPLRFGERSFRKVFPGQSTLSVAWGAWAFGVSTENQWWGPGIRNAIVLSDNAPGFPHLFLRTAQPVRTGLGEFEARLLGGGLLESDYFDRDPGNDVRTISVLGLEWRPRWVKGLSLGWARSVYAPASGWGDVPGAFLDALIAYPGRPNDRPLNDSTQIPGPDQIYSWFGRWVFPRSGLEVYGEFSKTEFPASVRDFLISPGHTLGYTLGLQWAKRLGEKEPEAAAGSGAPAGGSAGGTAIRLQAEHTFLERSSTFRQKPVGTYYTSRAVVQGYTNQGQVLGAAIGPGASSHWVAVDYVGGRWQAGIFGGRIRWENDALYTVPLPNPFIRHWCMHDVSLFGGLKGALSGPVGTLTASLTTGTRFNTYFRNYSVCGRDFKPEQAVDIKNTTLEFSWVAPLGRWLGSR